MESNFFLKIRKFLIEHIISLLLFPILIFVLLFTFYGSEFHNYIVNNPDKYKLYELTSIYTIFKQITYLPNHLRNLAFDLVIYSYVLFAGWLILFIYSCYYRLSRRIYNLNFIFLEFAILITVYVFTMSPGLPLTYKLLGYLTFLFLIVLCLIYCAYFKKIRHEKE